MTYSVQIY